MVAKRKQTEDVEYLQNDATVEIIPLGAGQEVGRSCIILKYMGKTIMFDCGIHPGYTGLTALPFFDEVDLSAVDVMIVTHFHLDHCAAVPYVLGNTNFKGRVLMTHPTKAIFATLLKDYVKVSRGSVDEVLYSEKDLEASLDRIEVLDFYQTVEINGILVTLYRAGHVLGAAMAMVEISGVRVLYTGDYSRIPDRHLAGADIPDTPPDILIVEATYGVSKHLPREEREQKFLEKVRAVVSRGGRVLLPVVALGRAQELLLMLDEYWEKNSDLQGVPVYQTSGLARRALSIYQTYIEMMNDDIKSAFQVANPFVLKHVTHLKGGQQFDDVGACVVLATPSMLQSGLSRDLFEAWCEDEKNGIIIADFAVQGTLAREILAEPSEVMTRNGVKVPLRASVDAISFSAHADFPQTSEFIDTLKPAHVVLVHGEAGEMARLKKALEQRAAATNSARNVYMPKVTQAVQIEYKTRRAGKVVGSLAAKRPPPGSNLRGLWVQRGFQGTLMAPEDLSLFTNLNTCKVIQRQAISLNKPFTQVRSALELMFEGLQGTGDIGRVDGQPANEAGEQVLMIAECVRLTYKPKSAESADPHVVVEWEGGSVTDMVADAVVAVILQAVGEPLSVAEAEQRWREAMNNSDVTGAAEAEVKLIAALLGTQFGGATVEEDNTVTLEVDGERVVVDHTSSKVVCDNESLRARVQKAVERLMAALQPCALDE